MRLLKRQKILLGLLQAFGGRLSNIDFQKYLFLFIEEYEKLKHYEFVPYQYGCFSFQSYADRRRLIKIGVMINEKNWQLANNDDYILQLDKDEQASIVLCVDQYKNVRGRSLIQHVYKNYPYYAINSEIASKMMNKVELAAIEQAKPRDEKHAFFTIGYEGHSFEHYLNRLIKHNIKVLCDVRKNPLSRKYGFSKSTLSDTLNKLRIQYIHLPELGILSEKRQTLKTLQDYDRLFFEYEISTLAQNNPALDQLESMLKRNKRIAITCFEATHHRCHRGRIAKALANRKSWHYEIIHI